jgi:hypothetical protein
MKMLLEIIAGSFLAISIISAGCHGNGHLGQTEASLIIPQDLIITLERTECFGTCPSYKLKITADGVVVFEGRRFVKQEGVTIKSAISQEQLKQLIAEFDRVKFFSLEDNYTNDRRVCAEEWTCSPSAITSIRISGKSKTIDHYHGCRGPKVPQSLAELEDKIDRIVNTAQWVSDERMQ